MPGNKDKSSSRNLIIERVRAGLCRARLEGRRIGREPLNVDREALLRDRARGMSLTYRISRTSVCRVLKKACPQSQHTLLKEDVDAATNLAS